MCLETADSSAVSIVEVIHERLKYPELFYHLCTKRHHNFVVNGTIAHNLNLRVQTSLGKDIRVDVETTDLISEVKAKITAESGVPAELQVLSLLGKQLDNDKLSLQDYNILGIGKDFYLDLSILNDPGSKMVQNMKQRFVVRFSSSQSIVYNFEVIRTLNVKQLI